MKKNLPTEAEIIALHKKYAPSEELFHIVYTHCLAVWRIAEQIIGLKPHRIDKELVKAGCMLHDIGTYTLIKPDDVSWVGYVGRGIEGERLIKQEGLPKELAEIVGHHVGHGLTKKHIKEHLSGILPVKDLTPQTIEERLVSYASKLHSRSEVLQFNSVDAYRKFIKELGGGYYARDFEALVKEFGEPNLKPLAKEFSQKIV